MLVHHRGVIVFGLFVVCLFVCLFVCFKFVVGVNALREVLGRWIS